jgi:TRAP-type C4-dicarboxylate transport system permease small subunit
MTVKKFINNFEEYFVVWSLAFMVLLVFLQVVMRYVFSNSLSWSEELARYVVLWLSWIGASYAVKERAHFRVEMLANLVKGRARKVFELFVLLVWFAFCLFLVRYGTSVVLHQIDRGQYSPAMNMHMSLPYAAVPVGCALMSLRLIIEMYYVLKKQAKEVS